MPAPQYVLRSYSGGDQVAQLTQQIGATDTSFVVAPDTGWVEADGVSPLGTTGPFTIIIDRTTDDAEKICCRSINLTTGLITVFVDTDGWSGRGYDGTQAIGHVPGTSPAGVQTCWSAAEAAEANRAVYAVLGAGGLSSFGVPIGTSLDFRGTPATLPTNFLLEDASAVNRTTYSALFTAITIATTGTTTNANPLISAIPAGITQYVRVGAQITLANSGGAVYTVQSTTSTSITVAGGGTGITAGTAGAITVYPHGAGNGTTTFNLPDSRGRVTAGQGAVGTNTQPTLFVGQTGGQSNVTLDTASIPASLTVTDSGHFHIPLGPASQFATSFQPSTLYLATSGLTANEVTLQTDTATATTGITVGGGGGSHENKPPFSVATKMIRAL